MTATAMFNDATILSPVGYPVVVKALDETTCEGVSYANDEEELRRRVSDMLAKTNTLSGKVTL